MEKEAKEAWRKYLNTWLVTPWIAAVVYDEHPFQDGEVLKHLADGFEIAGAAERGRSRYLKLDHETKLAGQEIKSLLFGHTIRGRDYWNSNSWAQKRTIDGKVSHSGQSIHIGSDDAKEGESWIEDDRLCDRWPEVGDEITICVLIFRDSDGGPNDYYMLTDQGPQQFWVSN